MQGLLELTEDTEYSAVGSARVYRYDPSIDQMRALQIPSPPILVRKYL
jgi:hypothetical protein